MNMIRFDLPQTLYERVLRLASRRNKDVTDVLEEALTLVERTYNTETEQMAQEELAYQQLLPSLLAQHEGAYVAIYQGQLVDSDADETALLRRIEETYPDKVVLLRQVQAEAEPVLRFRSPRFV